MIIHTKASETRTDRPRGGATLRGVHLVIGAIPPLLAVAAVVAAAALSQLPAGRLVQRIDVARVVRERAR
ncbi:hypothetical protein ACIHDR_10545 [Nocardia sp. NPDC052278]|uniref:hypothetical protein n=1 Tax=Nocardia sp. NPDC052278 TaxID=3364328 RepID=UPI0037C7EDC3